MFGSLLGKNSGEVKTGEVVKTPAIANTGVAMLMRSLGIDPAEMFQAMGEFQRMIGSAIVDVEARQAAVAVNVEMVREGQQLEATKLDALEARMVSMESLLERISEQLTALEGTPATKAAAKKRKV